MECGEFNKRNKEFLKKYTKESYFQNLLLLKGQKNIDLLKGKGKVIFDVGAHAGESAKFFNKIFPLAHIYSFEPNPKMAETLRKLKLKNHTVEEVALSNSEGVSNFNIQDISHLSSLHKINKKSIDSNDYHLKESHETIEVKTLTGDSYSAAQDIDSIDLLKIDVQANEVQTLEGFKKGISRVNNILVEVSFYDFYEKKSSIGSIEKLLPNFELFDIFEVSKNPKTLRTDWANIVYQNKK